MPSRSQQLSWTIALLLSVSLPALAAHRKIVGTPANRIAEDVLRRLISTSMGRAAPPLPWEVRLIQDSHINAYLSGAGKLTVTSGIVPLLGNDRGTWAAVLGHEIGHVVVHRQFKAYLPGFQAELQKAYLQARAAQADNGPARALHLVPLGGGLANLKLAREREYEADRVGLMMMAEAGYHPDFAIILDRRMRAVRPDQPKYAEFLSGHPRWASREERIMRAYHVALAIFESRWHDPAQSPGGNPPPLGTIGALIATQNAEEQSLVLHVPINVRNAAGMQVRVAAIFLDKGRRVQAAPEYRSRDGSLVLNSPLPRSSNESPEVLLRLPTTALATKHRKLSAVVFLVAGDDILDISSKPLRLNFAENQCLR